jgi:DNA-directed RNA polymerase specialized sigma24 family protein
VKSVSEPASWKERPSLESSIHGGGAAAAATPMEDVTRTKPASARTPCRMGSIRIPGMATDFEQARKLKRAAVEKMVAGVYAGVYRAAHGLLGREDAAAGVIRYVVVRAVGLLPAWRDEDEARRWFMHHSLLTARRAARHEASGNEDALVKAAAGVPGGVDAQYVAFVRAVRSLPQQQKEAVILHLGEHLNERYLAVAMDCSTQAAQMHLDAGMHQLGSMAGDQFEPLSKKLSAAYSSLGPGEGAVAPAVRAMVRKVLWPRRVKKIVTWVFVLLVLAGLGWAGWRWRHLAGW